LYSKTTGRVRAYGELSSEFLTSSGVHQGCPLSPLLFNFVIDMLLDITLSSSDFSGVDFLPGASLTDLEYADDIVLFGEDADKMQSLLTTLSNNASIRDIRLLTKERVYRAAVRSVLLYDSETWPLRVEDIRRLLVFDHRCLRSIARLSWDNRVSNAVVRKRVLGKDGKSIDEVLRLQQL
ncbi:Retrovirus-related Pol polyprotein from type-2 retrotransposable element R2DM, partial [Schistosoma japonicum]